MLAQVCISDAGAALRQRAGFNFCSLQSNVKALSALGPAVVCFNLEAPKSTGNRPSQNAARNEKQFEGIIIMLMAWFWPTLVQSGAAALHPGAQEPPGLQEWTAP